MNEPRRDVAEGGKHKASLVVARVRNDEAGETPNEPAIGQEVQIERTGPPTGAGPPPARRLNRLQRPKKRMRRQPRAPPDDGVEEPPLTRSADGLGFIQRRHAIDRDARR